MWWVITFDDFRGELVHALNKLVHDLRLKLLDVGRLEQLDHELLLFSAVTIGRWRRTKQVVGEHRGAAKRDARPGGEVGSPEISSVASVDALSFSFLFFALADMAPKVIKRRVV